MNGKSWLQNKKCRILKNVTFILWNSVRSYSSQKPQISPTSISLESSLRNLHNHVKNFKFEGEKLILWYFVDGYLIANHLRPDRRILSESCQSYLPSVVISGNTSPSLFCFSDDQRAGSPDTGMSARRGARTGLILINHHGYHSKHIMCPPHWSKLRTLCTILATSKLWCLNHALVGYLFNSLILNCASNYSTQKITRGRGTVSNVTSKLLGSYTTPYKACKCKPTPDHPLLPDIS